MIITVTLIQDSTFKSVSDSKIPILLVNNDNGNVSKTVFDNLQKSDAFSIVSKVDNQSITENQAKELVLKGNTNLQLFFQKN